MKHLMTAIAAVIFLASCKKEKTDIVPTPTPNTEKQMMKATYFWDGGSPSVDNYTYNADGKISQINDGTYTSYFDFVSSSSLVVTIKKNADNSLYRTHECTLNDKGAVTKQLIKNAAGVLSYTYEYGYNADGYLINQKGASPGGSSFEEKFTFVNGNPVSSINYDGATPLNFREYVYDLSKANNAGFSNGGYWNVRNLFGKPTKNLMTEYKDFNGSGTLTWHVKYSYELDTDGFPVKQNLLNALNGKTGVNSFIYK